MTKVQKKRTCNASKTMNDPSHVSKTIFPEKNLVNSVIYSSETPIFKIFPKVLRMKEIDEWLEFSSNLDKS